MAVRDDLDDLLAPLIRASLARTHAAHQLDGLRLGAKADPLDPASTQAAARRLRVVRPPWLDRRPCEQPPSAPLEGVSLRRALLDLLPVALRRRAARAVVRWLQ